VGAGRVSIEVQTEAVKTLARQRGDPEPELRTEMGVSGAAAASAFGGTGRGGRRKLYPELRDDIAAGSVSALYAYSLSRLARSTAELLALVELCTANGVPIHLAKEGTLDGSTPHGRLYLTILAAVATVEAEVAAERAQDRMAAARDRGDYIGRPPYGWRIENGRLVEHPQEAPILAAARKAIADTTSSRAAARLLNERGIPSPTGTRWRDGTIRRIVARDEGRPLIQDRTVRGSARVPSAMFARLLRCAVCGARLTPQRKRYTTSAGESRSYVGYQCQGARLDSRHPRPCMIAETTALAWAREELARLRPPAERIAIAESAHAERDALAGRRARLVDAIEHGTLTRQEVAHRLDAIEAELSALDARTTIADLPASVDWSAPIPEVQAQVAAIVSVIDVDIKARTFRATWRDPSLRASDDEMAR
jgi:DNA invertase Pin-like site-specific DNA recombinase